MASRAGSGRERTPGRPQTDPRERRRRGPILTGLEFQGCWVVSVEVALAIASDGPRHKTPLESFAREAAVDPPSGARRSWPKSALDPWLCVSGFRRICLYRAVLSCYVVFRGGSGAYAGKNQAGQGRQLSLRKNADSTIAERRITSTSALVLSGHRRLHETCWGTPVRVMTASAKYLGRGS
jgi:hypothetical protein